jgi:hypothetical protein
VRIGVPCFKKLGRFLGHVPRVSLYGYGLKREVSFAEVTYVAMHTMGYASVCIYADQRIYMLLHENL